jgi:glycosyltransferase involved in cell wall biosynthesis
MSADPLVRGHKRRGLFVVPIGACSVHTGNGQRTFHLYRALAALCELDILLVPAVGCEFLEDMHPKLFTDIFPKARRIHLDRTPANQRGTVGQYARRAALMLQSRAAAYRPSARATSFIASLVRQERYDFIVGRYLRPTSLSGALQLGGPPVFLDVDDRDEKVIESRLAASSSWPLRLMLRRQLRQIDAVADGLRARCAHLWLASAADCGELVHPSMSVLPNVPYTAGDGDGDAALAPPAGDTKVCLFVGTFNHRPNREGVMRFVEHGWPRIRAAMPDARFRIVGSGGWDAVRDTLQAHAGVEVVGTVADIGQAYAAAAFAVVPVFEGAGTKIKVLEALRHGRAVVAHAHSTRGFEELRAGESLLVGDDDEAIAAHCLTLLGDPGRAAALAAEGQRMVARHYSFGAFAEAVASSLAGVAGTRTADAA